MGTNLKTAVVKIDKKDWSTALIRFMKPGEEAEVVCQMYREMESAEQTVRNYATRYPDEMKENRIAKFETKRLEDFHLSVKAIPES